LQGVSLGAAGLEQAPVWGSQVPATWHWSLAVQVLGAPPTQAPLWQESPTVQALPSLQGVSLGAAGLEQAPVWGSQVPATWHWSLAVQVLGAPPTQAPLWQASPTRHASEPLQGVSLGAAGSEQAPVCGLQVPATWH